jgi:hypothetical protein
MILLNEFLIEALSSFKSAERIAEPQISKTISMSVLDFGWAIIF